MNDIASPGGPAQRYARQLETGTIQPDDAQARAVDALQRIHDELIASPPQRRLLRRRSGWPPVRGLYLWGGVGRGKTWLMDQFFEAIPFRAKRRTHFHRFMLEIHQQRRRYLEEQDPVALIGEAIAGQTRLLCFDEFFVSDIADAMILARLTEVLFREGVTLVATSNVEPTRLYEDGLQRDRFLPAIDRIVAHCQVMELASPTDFRLRALERQPLYLHPSDEEAMRGLDAHFEGLTQQRRSHQSVTLDINGRPMQALARAEEVVWFGFAELCEGPRAAADYIELAREHHTVLISHVPQLDASSDEAARRFVHLVDELYDRGVKLIVAADAPLESLYTGKKLAFEFQRTESRLIEMQSTDYLARPHRPV